MCASTALGGLPVKSHLASQLERHGITNTRHGFTRTTFVVSSRSATLGRPEHPAAGMSDVLEGVSGTWLVVWLVTEQYTVQRHRRSVRLASRVDGPVDNIVDSCVLTPVSDEGASVLVTVGCGGGWLPEFPGYFVQDSPYRKCELSHPRVKMARRTFRRRSGGSRFPAHGAHGVWQQIVTPSDPSQVDAPTLSSASDDPRNQQPTRAVERQCRRSVELLFETMAATVGSNCTHELLRGGFATTSQFRRQRRHARQTRITISY